MTRRKAAAAMTLALPFLLVAGCSGTVEPVSTPSSTAAAEPSSSPSQPDADYGDGTVACTLIFGGSGDGGSVAERIPTALIGIGSNITDDQLDELLQLNQLLSNAAATAPSDMKETLESIQAPFAEAQEVATSGGGSLSMDTSGLAADITTLMEQCTAIGYQVAGT